MGMSPDPLEVLAFIDGYSNMPSEQWRQRFPEWSALIDEAHRRFAEETEGGRRSWARSSAAVSNTASAVHHWVFLPLIRSALGAPS